MQHKAIVPKPSKLEVLQVSTCLRRVLGLFEDTEREHKNGIILIDGCEAMVAALVDIDDEIAEAQKLIPFV